MSKVVMSLPKGVVKNSAIGAVIALASYIGLQLVCALLIDRGVVGMETLYPMVCVTAAAASFLGCGYSVLRGRRILTVPVVVAVFLTLTLAAALLTADAVAVENGLTGIGLSMAAGGLGAALVGLNLPKPSGRGSRKMTRKRRKGR